MVINIHEHKRYYHILLIIHLFTESIQNTTQIFPTLNHNVRFLPPAPGRWHNAIRGVKNPVCIVLIIPGHSCREVPRQGCGHS